MAWGDGYEATTGEEHINTEYMQKVVDYTEDVVASGYGYLEDYGDIFLPEYKNSKESVLQYSVQIIRVIIQLMDVPTGRIH